jgi:NAD+ kinase
MKIAIYGKKVTKNTLSYFKEVFKIAEEYSWSITLELELKKSLERKFSLRNDYEAYSSYIDLTHGVDLMVSLGGDGSFMKAVDYIRDSGVPIIGINTGRLGFLSNNPKEFLQKALERILKKDYTFQKRSLIKVTTENNQFGTDNYALNELTIHKKDSASMITVHTFLDENFLNSYWSDGLIVSTPTGSTAYNLSCGGPIITPGCQVHILTPIAPHNLNVRPVVVPDHLPIQLSVEGRGRSFLLSLDGVSKSIKQGEKIIIQKAEFMINVIKFADNTFLDTIRNKMFWGVDKRNY